LSTQLPRWSRVLHHGEDLLVKQTGMSPVRVIVDTLDNKVANHQAT